ncbi:signal peptidase I [Paramicrobacterium fandaimingii]|uniref:signal peptidase I n=1 Tax=Paramicrobacterium fandaimingii TaxID=2708079 RepID=UPI0014203F95|nr:signal peptidase I [Microbacterium fandaimingii]
MIRRVTRASLAVASAIAKVLLLLLGLMGTAVVVLALTGTLKMFIVSSGSMSPVYEKGDLTFNVSIPASSIEIGDIVTLDSARTGEAITHRVISLESDGSIRMQGDAVGIPDNENYQTGEMVWKPAASIPWIGYPLSMVLNPTVLVLLIGGLLILAIFGDAKQPKHQPIDEPSIPAPSNQ